MRIEKTGYWYKEKTQNEIDFNNRLLDDLNNDNSNQKNNDVDVAIEETKEKLFDNVNYSHSKINRLLQNGYVKIYDDILFFLINKQDNKMTTFNELSLFLYLYKMTYGFQRNKWKVDFSKVSYEMAISKSYIYKLMKRLKDKGYISYQKKIYIVEITLSPCKKKYKRKGFTPIPDYMLYSIINKNINGMDNITDLQVWLYHLKHTFGYNETKNEYIQWFDNNGKKKVKIKRHKIGDYKKSYYLKDGYKSIIEYIGLSKQSLYKSTKKMVDNNMIDVNKGKDKIEISVNIDVRKWKECYDIEGFIKSIKVS